METGASATGLSESLPFVSELVSRLNGRFLPPAIPLLLFVIFRAAVALRVHNVRTLRLRSPSKLGLVPAPRTRFGTNAW